MPNDITNEYLLKFLDEIRLNEQRNMSIFRRELDVIMKKVHTLDENILTLNEKLNTYGDLLVKLVRVLDSERED